MMEGKDRADRRRRVPNVRTRGRDSGPQCVPVPGDKESKRGGRQGQKRMGRRGGGEMGLLGRIGVEEMAEDGGHGTGG